ncbi:septum formation initiator family protein [Candidatus Collierbacteria bacterium]|nr:septum formation initiator family protein [Candidatus Collierbacteria bacterium]
MFDAGPDKFFDCPYNDIIKIVKRRLYQLTVIFVGLFIIYGSSRNILELWQQKQRVWRIQKEVKDLEVKEADLKKQLEYYRSDEYVEKIAREKLLLQKEGETVVVLPLGQNVIQNSNLKTQNFEENQQKEQSIWERLMDILQNKFQ